MTHRLLIIPTFLLIIFAPPVMFFLQSDALIKKNIKHERRAFRKMPTLGFSIEKINAFPNAFEAFYNDHFGLRGPLVKLHDAIIYRVFGMSPRRTYLVGKNGWFFRGHGNMRVQKGVNTSFDAISDYLGQIPFTEDELKTWKKKLSKTRNLVRRRGGKYIFAIAPTKRMIYPEYLPDEIRAFKGQSRAEQLIEYLQKHSKIQVVNLIEALQKAKQHAEKPDLYYKTDFHWNYYGAYWAYRAIMDRAKVLMPKRKIRPVPLSNYNIMYKKGWIRGAFVSTFGVTIDDDEYPYLVSKGTDTRLNKITNTLVSFPPTRKNKRVRFYSNPNKTELIRMLIVGDSFILKSAPYFASNSKETYVVRNVIKFPRHIIKSEKAPQLVVQSIMADYLVAPPNAR